MFNVTGVLVVTFLPIAGDCESTVHLSRGWGPFLGLKFLLRLRHPGW